MNEPTRSDKLRLRSHFGFTRMPFAKNMKALKMFDSSSQRELLRGLLMWTDVVSSQSFGVGHRPALPRRGARGACISDRCVIYF